MVHGNSGGETHMYTIEQIYVIPYLAISLFLFMRSMSHTIRTSMSYACIIKEVSSGENPQSECFTPQELVRARPDC